MGELGLLYSRMPSGYSINSGHITKESCGLPGDLDLDLLAGLVRDLFHPLECGLGKVRGWLRGLGWRSLCSSGLYMACQDQTAFQGI